MGFEIFFAVADLIILVGVGLVLAGMAAMLYSAHLDVPFAGTPPDVFKKIYGALQIKPGDVVYELGSGDGRFILAAAREFPEARFVGLELNPLLYFYSQFRKRLRGNPPNLELHRKNFFDADLSEATKLYMYLLTPVMQQIYPKVAGLRGVRIASRAFQFKAIQPLETVELSKKIGSHGEHLLHVYAL